MTKHEFGYPKVTELALVKAEIEPDPFIDDLSPAEKLAKVIDLNANVISLEDFRKGEAA